MLEFCDHKNKIPLWVESTRDEGAILLLYTSYHGSEASRSDGGMELAVLLSDSSDRTSIMTSSSTKLSVIRNQNYLGRIEPPEAVVRGHATFVWLSRGQIDRSWLACHNSSL